MITSLAAFGGHPGRRLTLLEAPEMIPVQGTTIWAKTPAVLVVGVLLAGLHREGIQQAWILCL